MNSFVIRTGEPAALVDITDRVSDVVRSSDVKHGVCHVYVPHTTAGITVNEAADPTVRRDILMELDRIVPYRGGYAHAEGNSAAHIKASLMGSSVSIPVTDGKPALGTWQGIFLCEFDGPRSRTVHCTILGT